MVCLKYLFACATNIFRKIYLVISYLQDSYIIYVFIYIVKQSDGNSFCRDVVLNSFNKAYRDENNIIDQKYKTQICLDFYFNNFNSLFENAHSHNSSTKAQFYVFLVVMCCISIDYMHFPLEI